MSAWRIAKHVTKMGSRFKNLMQNRPSKKGSEQESEEQNEWEFAGVLIEI